MKRHSEIRAKSFSPEAIKLLERYDWPGNIRELKNIVERIAILCDAEIIEAKHLPENIRKTSSANVGVDIPSTWKEFKIYKQKVRNDIFNQIERDFLISALKDSGGNISKAAKTIGMQRTNFHTLLKKYNIDVKIS